MPQLIATFVNRSTELLNITIHHRTRRPKRGRYRATTA
jgi:hypothetical protein